MAARRGRIVRGELARCSPRETAETAVVTLAYLTPLFQQVQLPPFDAGVYSSAGISVAARPVAIAALACRTEAALLIVAPRLDTAERLQAALATLLPEAKRPMLWASPDPLPYEQLPHDPELSRDRISVLDELCIDGRDAPPIVITTVRALMALVRDPGSFGRDAIEIKVGQRIQDRQLIANLSQAGYSVEAVVDVPGQVSRRGGIIDIYTPGPDGAVRIELFGDEVESIRTFDPVNQRSTEQRNHVRILPPHEFDLSDTRSGLEVLENLDLSNLRPEVLDEWTEMMARLREGSIPEAVDLLASAFPSNQSTILDYLPPDARIVELDPGAIELEAEQIELRADEVRQTLEQAGEIPLGVPQPFANWSSIVSSIGRFPRWQIGAGADRGVEVRTRESFVEAPQFANDFEALAEDVSRRLQLGWRVIFATDQSERVSDLLADHDMYPRKAKRARGEMEDPPPPGGLDVVHAPIENGFALQSPPTLVLSDREIFGIRKSHRPPPRPARTRYRPARQFEEDGFVVHVEHGVGVFRGMVTLATSGIEREYLQIDYADNDRLYVPVDQSDRLAPYESPAGTPRITKLSSPEWNRTKSRVRQAVRDMANELIEIYAARELAEGHAYPSDSAWDVELAESFPFRETRDQQRAILEVKSDLESTQPMDRLVCGDVGYGKTEVALRAAFKVVNGGHQVAVLVPTTVLALQHYETFRERLAAFPVRIEMLSRLRTRSEQREILKGLADGSVDIIIGTHRLVQRDVNFRRLGMLVVDEEQRFGVKHKEYVKRQRAEVDVLTMTATPIPRTLYMALTGLRDLSLIATPPQERVPIRTFVTSSNDTVVREAILREMSRGGQVYVVHNRVQSIHRVREWIEELVPEVTTAVGHGQMDEKELEQVILSFMQHEFDVLVCTTIIESGVDIPNVNTIIIDNAHALGLTQLYQLRGRVGRGSHRAYAYLLYTPHTPLSAEARQRLAAIQEATELGAGFQIAMRDMEIRGAGNILGAEQSGYIAAVGLDLYTRMLSHAVEELRAGRPILEPEDINLDIAVDARIPSEYITNENIRLSIYHRVASAKNGRELREIRAELADRFGEPPPEVDRVMDLVRLRHRATELGITTLIERDGELFIRPVVGARIDDRALRRAVGPGIRVTPNQIRMRLADLSVDRWQAITVVLDAVEEIRDSILVS